MTLLEVLAAMVIFMMSVVAISQLMRVSTQSADNVRWQSRATRLAQSKLGEFVGGSQTITGGQGGGGNFDEEPEWSWTATVNLYQNVPNLYTVTITVSRDLPSGKHIESVLNSYVFDPAYKGNASTINSSSSSSSSGSSSSGSSSGSTGSSP
jgi:type II secretory pathway pseudopilin PulG